MTKRRFLKITLTASVVLLFAGYFSFVTFLFNPLEGALAVDVAALVPRDVDFYVSRADLADVVDEFPRLAVQDQLDENKGWQAWIGSPEYSELNRTHEIEKTLAELRTLAQTLPLGASPESVFGGKELAIAGYLRGRDLEQADWAVYGRVNWMGKLGTALLTHPSWIGLESQGIKATVDGPIVAIEGGRIPRKLYITRLSDVVIVATKPELAKSARDLQARSYADSFYLSATFADHIQNAPSRNKERNELEFFVNSRRVLESLQFQGPWPDTRSQAFLPGFLGRVFQLNAIKSAVGIAGFEGGAAIDVYGEFNSDLVSATQAKLYRTRGFDRDELVLQAAKLAPVDSAFFLYVKAGVGDLLGNVLDALEPAVRTNLEDALRNTGKYKDLAQVVKDLDEALKDRIVIIVRPNDYADDPEGPPHDDTPVPSIAIIVWPRNVAPIVALREAIGQKGQYFGLKGRKEGEIGFYSYEDAGFKTYEFWSPFMPGTGVIAMMTANDVTIVSNSPRMLGHIQRTFFVGGEKYPSLVDHPTFSTLVQSTMQSGNACLWANPRTVAPILRAGAQRRALDSINIDWKSERARLEDKVLREKFPGKQRGRLDAETQAKVDEIVDPELRDMETRIKAEQVPLRMAAEERWITYSEEITAALAVLSLNPKNFEIAIRVLAPLAAAKH